MNKAKLIVMGCGIAAQIAGLVAAVFSPAANEQAMREMVKEEYDRREQAKVGNEP